MFRLSNTPISGFPISRLRGSGHVELVVPILPFAAGQYLIDIALARQGQEYFVDLEDVVSVRIRGHDIYQSGETVDLSRSATVVTHRWIHFPEAGKRSDSGWIGNQLLQNTRN